MPVTAGRWLVVAAALCCLAAGNGKVQTSAAPFHLNIPPGFGEAPRIAQGAKQGASVATTGGDIVAKAWEHKALGCYALLQTTTAGKNSNIEELHRAVSESASAQGVKVSDYIFSETTSRFRFRKDTLRGAAVTRSIATGATVQVGFASCFYQPRRAARCELLCSDILEQFEK